MNDKEITKTIINDSPYYVLIICHNKLYGCFKKYELWCYRDGSAKLIISSDSKEKIKINLDIRNLKMCHYNAGFKLYYLYYKENC